MPKAKLRRSEPLTVERVSHYVFIAGPLTGETGEVLANVREAIFYGDAVASGAGIKATSIWGKSKIVQLPRFVPFIPHLFAFWDLMRSHEYEFWMEQCFAWLDRCDSCIRIPGASPGADREVARMIDLGKPVFYGLEEWITYWRLKASGK